jgi:hypothetical protein
MGQFSKKEIARLNKMSRYWRPRFELGSRLETLLGDVVSGTPVNAVNALQLLTISGVVKDGETVTINNPAIVGSDIYEFLSDTEQTKTSPTNIAVDITENTVKANGTLTLAAQPTANDTMTIGSKVYTFVAEADTDGEISIGTDLAATKVNVVAAINGTDEINDPHPLVSAGDFAVNDCVITAFVGGTSGNTISTVETFTNVGNVFAAATLGSGADCSAANAAGKLMLAITASDTQGVAGSSAGSGKVALTADVAGAAGNLITVADTLPNGSFGAGTLISGVNGTVGVISQTMIDSSYVYFCIAENTISGKNWRRLDLGSAY